MFFLISTVPCFIKWNHFHHISNVELQQMCSVSLGIITTGSDEYYIESYILLFSKDRKNWKLYKGALSKEKKVCTVLYSLTFTWWFLLTPQQSNRADVATEFTLQASWWSLWISNLVVMVPRCFRRIPMATSGSSTACFLLWWLGLFGYSHWAGMAELQLKSKSSAVLLPRSRQGHAQLLVCVLIIYPE